MRQFLAGSGTDMTLLILAPLVYGLFGNGLDVLLVACFVALESRGSIWHLLSHNLQWLERAGLTFSTLLVVLWGIRSLQASDRGRTETGLGKVLLLPCRTTHSRQFPK